MTTTITESDVDAIIADTSKTITGDISWQRQPGMGSAQKFRVEVTSDENHRLMLQGYFNPDSGKLSFTLVLQRSLRIYGLDLGAYHRNEDGTVVGKTHKHLWKHGQRDTYAYVPFDITAEWREPIEAWRQFCREANLRHAGTMRAPEMDGGMEI